MISSPLASRVSLLLSTMRRITGMPDYQAYLRHLREFHPDRALPSEREYFDLYLAGKYGNGFSRCC